MSSFNSSLISYFNYSFSSFLYLFFLSLLFLTQIYLPNPLVTFFPSSSQSSLHPLYFQHLRHISLRDISSLELHLYHVTSLHAPPFHASFPSSPPSDDEIMRHEGRKEREKEREGARRNIRVPHLSLTVKERERLEKERERERKKKKRERERVVF